MDASWLLLLAIPIGVVMALSGIGMWAAPGGNSWEATEPNASQSESPDGLQAVAFFLGGGLFGTGLGLFILTEVFPVFSSFTPLKAVGAALFALGILIGGLGLIVPLLSLIWWPMHRLFGPRWYTMLSKEQVKRMNKRETLLDVGGKEPRPRAAKHLAVYYGRQMTPPPNRSFPKAAGGHLWISKRGLYFDPWQRTLGEEGDYRKLYTWAAIKDTQVIPPIRRAVAVCEGDGVDVVLDHNPLNWLRGPKLVVHTARSGEPPVMLQFTINYWSAKYAKRGIDDEIKQRAD